jgi:hypothetical protein
MHESQYQQPFNYSMNKGVKVTRCSQIVRALNVEQENLDNVNLSKHCCM